MVRKGNPGIHLVDELKDWHMVVDLSPLKEQIESIASKREKQKINYKSSRQWSDEATNLTGLKGEFAFSLCTGLPVDTELRKDGDSGVDFTFEGIKYDIKTTKFSGENPMLLEMTGKKLVPHVYVLVRVEDWCARIIGWASRKQVRNARLRSMGYGPRLSISKNEMREWGQDTIPPCVPSSSTSLEEAIERAKRQLSNTSVRIKLPKEDVGKQHCFPHGPLVARKAKSGRYPAMYCSQCGRFYGIDKTLSAP